MSQPAQDVTKNITATSIQRGLALVVDDDLTNRLVLKGFLETAGFEVIQAEDGLQAIEHYKERQPDIVFMDVMMPVMNGFESSVEIKSIKNGKFVPIIFVTAMTNTDTITRCIDAGGDDFINKPIDNIQLQAKINSMERIRDMHREIIELNNKIYHEQKVAEHIFTDIVGKSNIDISHIHSLLRPVDLFSGDMLLTAFSPSRDIHILLADFTGHGLSAALGALPASETFHAMATKGYSIDEILRSINTKLKHLLPTNMFMAAQYVIISHDLCSITTCNCGMPDILLLDKKRKNIKKRIPSQGMALGIDKGFYFPKIIQHFPISYGDRIILSSDGILESTNINGEQFGEKNFELALLTAQHNNASNSFFDDVIRKFDTFCQDAPATDDVSLIEIPCIAENLPPWDMQALFNNDEKESNTTIPLTNTEDVLEASSVINLVFNSSSLKNVDPVPLVINNINELSDCDIPRQSLFVILTELYINALDHGILNLDSKLKSSTEGFERYFSDREERLNQLNKGYIRIHIQMHYNNNGGQFNLTFEDSGSGFNIEDYNNRQNNENDLSGRGIYLIKQLCTSITYYEPGNKVKVIYKWNSQDV